MTKFFKEFFDFAEKQPTAFVFTMAMLIGAIIFIIVKFRIKWDGWKPTFQSRGDEKHKQLRNKLNHLEEQIRFSQAPEFFKKTDNGDYAALFIAKKPYIAIWTDGHWGIDQTHDYYDKFDRLWESEDELVIHGIKPIPQDIIHIIDKKLIYLPKLTIFCSSNTSELLQRIYNISPKVTIVVRN